MKAKGVIEYERVSRRHWERKKDVEEWIGECERMNGREEGGKGRKAMGRIKEFLEGEIGQHEKVGGREGRRGWKNEKENNTEEWKGRAVRII